MEGDEQEFAQAQKRGRARRRAGYAVAARYDTRTSRIVVRLNTGLELAFAPSLAEGLAGASPAELVDVEISPAGLGLHWPKLTQTYTYRRCSTASLVPGVGWRRSSGPPAAVPAAKPRRLARAPTAAKVAARARMLTLENRGIRPVLLITNATGRPTDRSSRTPRSWPAQIQGQREMRIGFPAGGDVHRPGRVPEARRSAPARRGSRLHWR